MSSIYIAQSLLVDRRITTQSLSMRIFAHIQNKKGVTNTLTKAESWQKSACKAGRKTGNGYYGSSHRPRITKSLG
jgi:hypothetical protein